MKKETRTHLPPEVTRVRNAYTGEIVSMRNKKEFKTGTHDGELLLNPALSDQVHPPVMCEVNEDALKKVLVALMGQPHYIREIQATRLMPDNPLNILIDDYDAWLKSH